MRTALLLIICLWLSACSLPFARQNALFNQSSLGVNTSHIDTETMVLVLDIPL